MTDATHLRPATITDLPAMLEIYNHAILYTTSSYHYEPRTAEQWAVWYSDKNMQGMPVSVAVDAQDQVIGWSTFGTFRGQWAGYRFSVEHSLYVAEKQRGRGLGKLLLQGLIDEAKQRGYHTMVAGVDATNTVSLRLHQSTGFFQVAHFREVGYKFDRWLDLIFLQLMLS